MTDTQQILAFLDRVKATADAATEGPWSNYYHRKEVFSCLNDEPDEKLDDIAKTLSFEDGDFIASSRQAIPQLEQALRVAVEKLEACKNAAELLQGTSSRGAIEFRETIHTIATICKP